MDKLIKYFYILTIIVGSIFISVNVAKNNKDVDFISTYNSEDKNTNLEYVTIQEIRNTKDEIVKELEDGKYSNLIVDNMYVSVSSEDEICNMHEYTPGLYHGITDPMEMYDMQLDIIHYYLGDDLSEEYIVDTNSNYEDTVNIDGGWLSRDYKEIYKHLEEGTYEQICSEKVYGYSLPCIQYKNQQYGIDCYIAPDLNRIRVFKGKLSKLTEGRTYDPEADGYECLGVYYPDSENVDDVYKLQNGEISVKDAIVYVEDYFKNQLPYDISIGADKKVAKVGVYKITEENICFEFSLVRIINGMETEYGSLDCMMPYGEYIDEICKVIMVDIDDIDQYTIINNILNTEKEGETVEKVVSLESALQCVSDKIGKNSEYYVTEARMAYRRKIINDRQFENEYECIPCWIIRGENQSDKRRTIFYVSLIDGKVEYIKQN